EETLSILDLRRRQSAGDDSWGASSRRPKSHWLQPKVGNRLDLTGSIRDGNGEALDRSADNASTYLHRNVRAEASCGSARLEVRIGHCQATESRAVRCTENADGEAGEIGVGRPFMVRPTRTLGKPDTKIPFAGND